jgi:hypothetical protein
MSKELEQLTREQIMEFLPAAMKRACIEYHTFMDGFPDSAGSKKFLDKHAAGKAAIAHIQLLAKLSEWAGITKKSNEYDDFDDFMQVARKAAGDFEIPPQDLV